jgi:hypothetical protein
MAISQTASAHQMVHGDLEAAAAERDRWRQQAKDAGDEATGVGRRLAALDAELSTARSRLEAVQARRPVVKDDKTFSTSSNCDNR